MRLIDADAFEKTMTDKILPILIKKYGEEEAVKGLHFSFQDCISNIRGEPTVETTFYGYNVAHLAMVASLLNDHHLTPAMIAYMCTDIAITYDTVIELIQKQSIDSIMNYIMKGEED